MCSVLCISVLATLFAITTSINPKSVQLLLETCINIDRKDANDTYITYKVIDKINQFLNQIKRGLLPDNFQVKLRTEKSKYLTEFLNDVAKVISDFDDRETIWFFKKLYDVMSDYFYYKGSPLIEIVQSSIARQYLDHTIKAWSETDPFIMKMRLNDYVERGYNENNSLKETVDFLNDFYKDDDVYKMNRFVEKLKECKKQRDFESVIKNGLNSLVFQHYDRMNYSVRTNVSKEINRISETFLGQFKKDETLKPTTNIRKLDQTSRVTVPSTNDNSKIDNTDDDKRKYMVEKEDSEDFTNEVKNAKRNFIRAQNKQYYKLSPGAQSTRKRSALEIIKDTKRFRNKIQRENDYRNSVVKRRLRKIKKTTRNYVVTGMKFKPFILRQGINETLLNGDSQAINDTKNATSVSNINISTNNTTVPQANQTTKSIPLDIHNFTQVSQNITISTNTTGVPLNITKGNDTYVPQFHIKNATGLRVIDISNFGNFTTRRYLPRGNATYGLKLIDVAPIERFLNVENFGNFTRLPDYRYNASDITLVPRVLDDTENGTTGIDKNVTTTEVTQVTKKNRTVTMKFDPNHPFLINRERYYVPPKARLSFTPPKPPSDIEDMVNRMNID